MEEMKKKKLAWFLLMATCLFFLVVTLRNFGIATVTTNGLGWRFDNLVAYGWLGLSSIGFLIYNKLLLIYYRDFKQ